MNEKLGYIIVIGLMVLVVGAIVYNGITSWSRLIEMREELEARIKEWKEWAATTENKECFASCKELGYTTHISAPNNCVCDTTKLVIGE